MGEDRQQEEEEEERLDTGRRERKEDGGSVRVRGRGDCVGGREGERKRGRNGDQIGRKRV